MQSSSKNCEARAAKKRRIVASNPILIDQSVLDCFAIWSADFSGYVSTLELGGQRHWSRPWPSLPLATGKLMSEPGRTVAIAAPHSKPLTGWHRDRAKQVWRQEKPSDANTASPASRGRSISPKTEYASNRRGRLLETQNSVYGIPRQWFSFSRIGLRSMNCKL